jgi:hypothetical protein
MREFFGDRGRLGRWNWECGLRPLRAVGSIYEPEAVGAIGAYAPEGRLKNRKKEVGKMSENYGI